MDRLKPSEKKACLHPRLQTGSCVSVLLFPEYSLQCIYPERNADDEDDQRDHRHSGRGQRLNVRCGKFASARKQHAGNDHQDHVVDLLVQFFDQLIIPGQLQVDLQPSLTSTRK